MRFYLSSFFAIALAMIVFAFTELDPEPAEAEYVNEQITD